MGGEGEVGPDTALRQGLGREGPGTLGRYRIRPHRPGHEGSPESTLKGNSVPPEGGGEGAHLHARLPVLRAVQLIVLVAVLVLAVLQEGDLLQHRATHALFAIFAGRIPAHDMGAEGGISPTR